jgi:hypothetical protein
MLRYAITFIVIALCSSCARSSIWNASDLTEWVKDQAAQQGCERDSIKLEEWYRSEGGKNVWHGTCRDRKTGQIRSFAIPVDSVWKQSGNTTDKSN